MAESLVETKSNQRTPNSGGISANHIRPEENMSIVYFPVCRRVQRVCVRDFFPGLIELWGYSSSSPTFSGRNLSARF